MPISINGAGSITGISAGGLPDDCITTAEIAAGAVTQAELGSSEASGLAKAWVNFNGTGTVAIRASYNVSSITDNGIGTYTVNFSTALPDANYVVTCETAPDNASGSAGAWLVGVESASGSGPLTKTTTQVRIRTSDLLGSVRDYFNAGVAIFR